MSSQVGGGPFQRAAFEAELGLDLGADVDLVGGHVPVEDRVAAAGHRQRAPLGVGAARPRRADGGEGALHDGEADQHDDQHQTADQSRRGDVVGQLAERRRAGGDHPDDEQEPGRDQHHRAVRAARRHRQDEQEADRRRRWRSRCARRRRRPARCRSTGRPPPPSAAARPCRCGGSGRASDAG